MNNQIEAETFLELSGSLPVIDVRSPKEYLHAHIPGAVNVPIFSDEERARVGTCYKKEGRDAAVILGLDLVGPKLSEFARRSRQLAEQNKLLVHCWRGGMRSSSMAWLFNTAGVQTYTLAGGYKSYRRYLKRQFAKKSNLVVLGGMTGSGKTEILREIENKGHQIIDLEKQANHKGSVFGALGQKEQPGTEQFENILFEVWRKLDVNQPIWIEDESKTIGKVNLPEELYLQMRKSEVINIRVPIEKRVDRLVSEYGCFKADELKNAIQKIKKRLGGQNAKLASEAVDNNKLGEAAKITLLYYDKAYDHGLSQRNGQTIYSLELNDIDYTKNATKVIEFYQNLTS